MPTFVVKSRNWEGKVVTNELEGDSKDVVVAKLRESVEKFRLDAVRLAQLGLSDS